jgi:hypothetical protein
MEYYQSFVTRRRAKASTTTFSSAAGYITIRFTGLDSGDCDIIVTSLRKPVNIRLSAAGPICFQDMVTDYLKQCQKENAINGPVG